MTPPQQSPQKRFINSYRRGRRHNPTLSEPATDGLADPPRAGDEGNRTDDHAANRRAQPLAETETYAIKARAVFFQFTRASGDGFPEASAI